MTLETWKQEFYPVPASEVAKEEAGNHGLQKWIGLRHDNLLKHQVVLDEFSVCEDYDNLDIDGEYEYLDIDGESCALCEHYFMSGNSSSFCVKCPLYFGLGHKRCDQGKKSPYAIWLDTHNPEPMIEALAGITLAGISNESD